MSNLSRLRDNIAAIEYALTGKGEREVMNKYTGFGGLGFILNPIDDKAKWNKTDMTCYEDTVKLYELLKREAGSEKEYKKWVASMKSSTLTAYYTPEVVVKAVFAGIADGAYHNGRYPLLKTMLDPAAGATGVFMKQFGQSKLVATLDDLVDDASLYPRCTAFEKDILSGMILNAHRSMGETVYVDGFEHFPDEELGTYDLVATNVPFGAIAVYDEAYSESGLDVRREAAQMIHRYYVLKGLDCLREGGIEAYIITSNYLNNDTEQVAYALKQARLIGAYRLANNLFKENGTEIGTDLLVLQKDSKRGALSEDEKAICTPMVIEGCATNGYFVRHNDHIVATNGMVGTDAYGKKAVIYKHSKGAQGIAEMLGERLSRDMASRFDADLGGKTAEHTDGGVDAQPVTITVESTDGDVIAGQGTKKAPAKGASDMKKITGKGDGKGYTAKECAMVAMYNCYCTLYEYEHDKQVANDTERKLLNSHYDLFVEKYGYLHDQKNRKAVERVSKELLSLEIEKDGRWTKAEIFERPVAFATDEGPRTLTAREALATSLNEYGKPVMQYMAGLCGLGADELVKELEGEVFWNPLNEEWEIKAKFVSGNVVEKIERIEAAYPEAAMASQQTEEGGETDGGETAIKSPDNGQSGSKLSTLHSPLSTALTVLKQAVPTPIPFEQLDFNLGERWVDASIYERFASDFFSMEGSRVTIKVRYQSVIDMYAVACTSSANERIRTRFSVGSECSNTLNGIDLLTHALHNSTPKLYKYKRDQRGVILCNEDGEELKTEDTEAEQLANDKIEEIRQGYIDWLLHQPKDVQDKMAREYNRRYNCIVKPQYDGSHLTLSDVDWDGVYERYGFRTPYRSQLDAIWMLVLLGGGIVDHEVGGGKTFIMCAGCHEQKRLGMVHKPIIIGMKANVAAIAEMYRTMYPKDKLLFATEKDYSAANRVEFFNKMKNNNWDCIIMSHDQFGKIPQSDAIQEELLDDELQQLEDALNAMEEADDGYEVTKKQRRGLEQRKRNLESKQEKLQSKMNKQKDAVVDFDMMGIDMIFVDESHVFKNLGFSTRHDRVAGIGNTDGSNRAFNLLMAIRTIQNKTHRDLGAVFLSGTTVTNSLTELYAIFRYLRPKALERQGITCFDAWAALYTRKSSEWEFGVTNNIQLKERFRYFIKVPELAMFYNEITDYRTAADVGLDRPAMNRILLKLQPTPDQEEYIKVLMEFAKTGDFSLIGKVVNEKQEKAKMLYATDLARKMSLDMREIDPAYGDHPGNKATQCAVLCKRYYDAFNPVKGVQLVFCDLSAWKGKQEWSVYGEIKKKLVDMGVPPEEVRFIQEASSDKVKQQMIALANEGKIRVLFGSTQTLGTGVNVQDRVVCIHELDTPWRPSDMEQREGRGVRKGNWVAKKYAGNKVDVIIYAVERSLDAYKFHLLHCKQVFISQLKRGQLSVRTLDEGDMDEKGGMSFAEYTAVLSGNTDLLERAKLEKRIAALEAAKKLFYREQAKREQKLADLQHDRERLERDIPDCQQDLDRYEAARQTDEYGQVVNALELRDCPVPDGIASGSPDWAKLVGTRLLQLDRETDTSGQYLTIGSIYGFEVLMRTDIGIDNKPFNLYFVKGRRIMYRTALGTIDHRGPATAVTYPLEVLQTKLADDLDQWTRRLATVRKSIAEIEAIATEEWGKDDELAAVKQQLADLDKRIKQQLDQADSQQQQAQQTGGDQPAVRFEKDGRYHRAVWQREVFSLVSADEMRKVINGMRGYGHLSDSEWRSGERVPLDEWTAEFYSSKDAADFIEAIEQMQKERQAEKEAA